MKKTYPDLTPRSFPDQLQSPAYDPFHLIPRVLPDHPRVLVSADCIRRTRQRLKRDGWAKRCMHRLLSNCDAKGIFDRPLPFPMDRGLNNNALGILERNALAFALNGRRVHHEVTLHGMRRMADLIRRRDPVTSDHFLVGGNLNESRAIGVLGHVYDLLAIHGLSAADDRSFRRLLETTRLASDRNTHLTCGNHNSWSLVGRISIALALGNRQWLHDALYGCLCPAGWRYGLIHQLRHDILSDGMHWERSFGYHYYTLMAFTEAADMLANSGIDIWHAELPTLKQDDTKDLHRAYGPEGLKCLKAAYDAPFYMAFANGDLSLLHDSGLANLRGTYIWGIVYDKAYEAYQDPKYAGLLNRIERDYPDSKRACPGVPMSLQSHRGDLDFARVRHERYPAGRFSLKRDTLVSLSGEHRSGHTLFPVYGAAVLRGGDSRTAPGAFVFYGPHSAGHQSPAALHLDVQLGGRVVTGVPRLKGYEDPRYLAWGRTTTAFNTVTIDERSMFPYEAGLNSIWECDHWRDAISDGELVTFNPDSENGLVRVRNTRVYPGVCLDRSVLVAPHYVLDVYRVTADSIRQIDWTSHVCGRVPVPRGSSAVRLGRARGYCHLKPAYRLPVKGGNLNVCWETDSIPYGLNLQVPRGGRVVMAREPTVEGGKCLGELNPVQEQSAVMVRVRGRSALFVSVWSTVAAPAVVLKVTGTAGTDVTVDVGTRMGRDRWSLPMRVE